MANSHLDALINLMGEYQTPRDTVIEHRRQRFEELMDNFPASEDVAIEATDADGIPCIFITTPEASGDLTVFYIHGGGFLFGSPHSHRDLCARMSASLAVPVFSTDYRLAPEHQFPAALEDVETSYRWLLGQEKHANQIIVAGDSAGACLALALLVLLRDSGEDLPAGCVLISPWIDLTAPSDWTEVARQYSGGFDLQEPLVSPYFADMTGLPPLLIQVGTNEPLLDQSRRLAKKATERGVTVQYEEWEGMIHAWHLFAARLPEGRQAIDRIAAFCQELRQS